MQDAVQVGELLRALQLERTEVGYYILSNASRTLRQVQRVLEDWSMLRASSLLLTGGGGRLAVENDLLTDITVIH